MCKKILYFLVVTLTVLFCCCFSVAFEQPYPELTLAGKDEYDTFVENTDLYDDFVYYDRISFLGEINTVYYLDFYDGAELRYYLIPDSGEEVVFRCYSLGRNTPSSTANHGYDTLLKEHKETTLLEEDLRHCSESEFCRISIGSCSYLYNQGSLWGITWKDNGWFLLYFKSGYPEGSYYERLYDRNTAADALEELESSVKDSESNIFLWIALPVGAAVIAGGAAFVLIRKKRRTEN